MIVQVEDFGRFQTANPMLRTALSEARRIAPTLNPVMIMGDSGSGRKEMALEIFEKSTRSQYRLLRWASNQDRELDLFRTDTVIIENLESFSSEEQLELFEQLSLHSKRGPLNSPRWIATAGREIRRLVKSGHVHLQLFQMLATHVLNIPNLNERAEDISYLAKSLVKNWNQITQKSKLLSEEVLQKLQHQAFDQNVEQLIEMVQKAYFQSEGEMILASDFGWQEPTILQTGMPLSEMERRLILQTLEMTKQNRTKAAEILGISIRTLRNKLQEYRAEGALNEGGTDEQSLR